MRWLFADGGLYVTPPAVRRGRFSPRCISPASRTFSRRWPAPPPPPSDRVEVSTTATQAVLRGPMRRARSMQTTVGFTAKSGRGARSPLRLPSFPADYPKDAHSLARRMAEARLLRYSLKCVGPSIGGGTCAVLGGNASVKALE